MMSNLEDPKELALPELTSWQDPGARGRALLYEFLAVQHFIRDEKDPLRRSLAQAQDVLADAPEDFRSSRLLLDVLEAHEMVHRGEISAALDLYRQLLEREVAVYDKMNTSPGTVLDENVNQRHVVLSVLHYNIAVCLEKTGGDAAAVIEHYRHAIAYDPRSTLFRYDLAHFCLRHQRWDEAAVLYREAFATSLLFEREDDLKTLYISLAIVYLEKAQGILNSVVTQDSTKFDTNLNLAEDRKSVRHHKNKHTQSFTRTLKSLVLSLLKGIVGSYRKSSRRTQSQPTDNSSRHLKAGKSPKPNGAMQDDKILREALKVLDFSLDSITWSGIPAWKGKTLSKRASILEKLRRYEEAAETFALSSDCYLRAEDLLSATYTSMCGGDALALAQSSSIKVIAAVYEEALGQLDLNNMMGIDATQAGLRRRSLKERLAFTSIAEEHYEKAEEILEEQYKSWNKRDGWGPYYETLSVGAALLSRRKVRHSINVYYHQLLRDHNANFVRARDLTAALLKLYKHEHEADDLEDNFRDASTRISFMTPLAIEISEHFGSLTVLTDEVIKRYASPVRTTIMKNFGVRVPGVAVRTNASLSDTEYVLLIREVPMARGKLTGDSLYPAFRQMEDFLVANLAEFVGHQEVQNFLERNLLVRPELKDIAAKEHYRHMDPLSAVLRALLMERVPIGVAYEFSVREVKDVRSLVRKIHEGSDPVSSFLNTRLLHNTRIAMLDCLNGTTSHDKLLIANLVGDLNRVISDPASDSVELEKCLLNNSEFADKLLREKTKLVLSQGQSIRDSSFFLRMLLEDAYPDELAKMRQTYPEVLYNAFRAGCQQEIPLYEIVENIRQLPEVRERLWGNDTHYTHLIFPDLFETWLVSNTKVAGGFRILILDREDRRHVAGSIRDKLKDYDKPALVVLRHSARPLVRALIADANPSVPVLSARELRTGKSTFKELSGLYIPQKGQPQ